MGLDVYVGSLTRYFSGDWETIIQRGGREQGYDVQVVRAHEPEDAVTDPNEVRALTREWLDALAEALETPLAWSETGSEPYFTDKPDWDGYGSVQVLAALDERGKEKRPREAVTEWTKDRNWKKAARAEARYAHLYGPELWFPAEVPLIQAPAPTGETIRIGSVDLLLDALRDLNERTFRLGPDARRDLDPSEGGFDEAAQFGLAILLELGEQAVEHRLPMKLDY